MNWVHFLCAPCSVCTNENDSWHSFSQMSKNMRIAYHAGIYAVTNVNSGSCHNWKDSTTIRCESGIGHYWIQNYFEFRTKIVPRIKSRTSPCVIWYPRSFEPIKCCDRYPHSLHYWSELAYRQRSSTLIYELDASLGQFCCEHITFIIRLKTDFKLVAGLGFTFLLNRCVFSWDVLKIYFASETRKTLCNSKCPNKCYKSECYIHLFYSSGQIWSEVVQSNQPNMRLSRFLSNRKLVKPCSIFLRST